MLQQGKCIALLQLDMDNFKSINDLYGNSAGDSVLQQISGLLLRESRGADYVVRYAGEQFVLVLRDVEFSSVRDVALAAEPTGCSMRTFQTPGRPNCVFDLFYWLQLFSTGVIRRAADFLGNLVATV